MDQCDALNGTPSKRTKLDVNGKYPDNAAKSAEGVYVRELIFQEEHTILDEVAQISEEGKTESDAKILGGDPSCLYLRELARPNVLKLKPYRCARDDYDSGILLDANENSVGSCIPPPDPLHLNRYPDPYMLSIKKLICKIRPIRHEQIFLGVGSDEAIDLSIRIFCKPGIDKILVTPPTYGMYMVCANINDVGVITVPLSPEFDVRIPETLAAVDETTKLLFLCSPGNPTSKLIPNEVVREIFQGGYRGIVVVDEAYVDFSPPEKSALNLLDEFPRLVVLRTFSKAFGLAGIRLGMAVGHPDVIRLMNNCKYPYNISKLTEDLAIRALSDTSIFEANLSLLLQERERVVGILKSLPMVKKVHDSDANFILFQIDFAYQIYKHMAENGCVIRYRGMELFCEGCLRATVGTPKENDTMLQKLQETYNLFLNDSISAK